MIWKREDLEIEKTKGKGESSSEEKTILAIKVITKQRKLGKKKKRK